MYTWFMGVLRFFWCKKANILFVGLDNAGKTTLLNLLKNDCMQEFAPTQHPTSEEVMMGGINFKIFDVGGHAPARTLWRDYYSKMDAIVYVIDATDVARMPEAAQEFRALYSTLYGTIPVLVLGNKIDVQGALSEHQLRIEMGISAEEKFSVRMCSFRLRVGYSEGFKWLTQQIS
jgi:GTP-binding protein SAR1